MIKIIWVIIFFSFFFGCRFQYLSFLTTLELSNCQLGQVQDEAFLGLDNLEWLKLDGNRITTLQGHHILPQSLHGINMQGNRWNCDCKLIDLHSWLITYNVPQQFEDPKCMTPERLAGQVIKHLKTDDLACLPEITPASQFFELTEGRNISLLCKITSSPDVSITWWFQGHLLQNDTFTSQNMHIYYFIDEGNDDKHSELFIYNVVPEMNGTFSCVAENSAGKFIANYTIRVLIKEEPVVEEINFAYEYFIVIIVGAGVAAFVIVLTCCCIVLKCKRKSKRNRKFKSGSQDATLQLQSNQIKFSGTGKTDAPTLYPILKNGNYSNQHKDMQLTIGPSASLLTHHNHSSEIAAVTGSQCCSPPSIRNYQDQNPDLINDAESVKSRTHIDVDDAASEQASIGPCSIQGLSCENGYHPSEKMLRNAANAAIKYNPLTTLPQGINKDLYHHHHQVDVHLSPGCFLAQNLAQKPYPIGCYQDYQGMPSPLVQPHLLNQPSNQVNFYRTLPHKPKAKAPHGVRFSLEAEFLNQGSTFAFDTYNLRKDIRYTVEGYPKPGDNPQVNDQQFPSPPEGYKNDAMQPIVGILDATHRSSNSAVVCAAQPQQWPTALPGYNVTKIDPIISSTSPSLMLTAASAKKIILNSSSLEKDVIPEQTEEEEAEQYNGDKLRQLTGPLADSPDEGYGGDATTPADTWHIPNSISQIAADNNATLNSSTNTTTPINATNNNGHSVVPNSDFDKIADDSVAL